MLAPLLGAVRADIDRQVGWATKEARRQIRHTALTGTLMGAAALAALGAATVGLIALYTWLAMRLDPFVALAIIGAGLLALALILFTLAAVRRRPPIASRPPLQAAQPAALLGTLGRSRYDKVAAGASETLKLASATVREGSRSRLIGTLAVAVLVGLIAGRRI
jgi:hypothetical protein